MHAIEALAPSYKQFQRLGQATFDKPTKRGKYLDTTTFGINDQVLGLMGLRPISVDPLDAMGFKISGFQQGIRNARREFTGGFFGLLRGGSISANDIIERYIASNKARFHVQKEMFKDLEAAGILGTNNIKLLREFRDRQLSPVTFNNLKKGKFMPYYPSRDIIARFREIAKNLGEPNVYKEAAMSLRALERDYKNNFNLAEGYSTGGAVDGIKTENAISEALPVIEAIKAELNSLNLKDEFDVDINEYVVQEDQVQEEIVTPPLPPEVTSAMPSVNVITQGQTANAMVPGSPGASGLTPTEEALLSPEEKLIKQRYRGMIS